MAKAYMTEAWGRTMHEAVRVLGDGAVGAGDPRLAIAEAQEILADVEPPCRCVAVVGHAYGTCAAVHVPLAVLRSFVGDRTALVESLERFLAVEV